jgi:hypothetical protein
MSTYIYATDVSTNTDVAIPVGQTLIVGSTGNQQSFVNVNNTLVSLSNRAQGFGPYAGDRVATITNYYSTVEYDVGLTPTLRSFPNLIIENISGVGLVQPAATFATLTYETNAGLVRLVSAGAHGLTAAIAVGASVYVTWATGTGVNGLYAVTALDADTTGVKITINYPYILGLGTPTVAVANTVVTIASVTIPAWSMGVGGGMEIDSLFSMTNNATVKTLGMTLAGTSILSAALASNASVSIQKNMVNRGSSAIITNSTTSVGHGLSTGAVVSVTADATTDLVFLITAQPATANNLIRLEYLKLNISF